MEEFDAVEFVIFHGSSARGIGIKTSDLGLGIPSSEDDIIENLARNKILSGEMGGRVKGMRGFRNFLVHRYGRMDDKVAFEYNEEGRGRFFEIHRGNRRFFGEARTQSEDGEEKIMEKRLRIARFCYVFIGLLFSNQ